MSRTIAAYFAGIGTVVIALGAGFGGGIFFGGAAVVKVPSAAFDGAPNRLNLPDLRDKTNLDTIAQAHAEDRLILANALAKAKNSAERIKVERRKEATARKKRIYAVAQEKVKRDLEVSKLASVPGLAPPPVATPTGD